MKTVGKLLRKARVEKGASLEQISKETRISIRYLTAIEENDFNHLPASTFTKGFLQNYAKAVDLDPKNVLAIFRRDYDQDERGRIIPRGLEKPVNKQPINIFNPTTTTVIFSVAVAVIIVGFFVRQIFLFTSAPDLEISAPIEGAVVSNPVVVVGTTTPEVSITVNNKSVSVDDVGAFMSELQLTPGQHTLVIAATSRNEKQKIVQRVILVEK